MSTVGERIKEARVARGLGRGELAKMLKCTYTAIHNWEERGMNPRPHMLVRIAKVLGVSEQALSGTGKKSEPRAADIDDFLKKAEREAAALLGIPAYRIQLKLELLSK